MTGLWQVSGRSDLSWDEAVRLDLYYVDNWSLAYDLSILWRTVGSCSPARARTDRCRPYGGLADGGPTGQDRRVSGNVSAGLAVVALVTALVAALFGVGRLRARRGIATATQRATYEVLHTAGLAAAPLRTGLDETGAGKAVRHLRALVARPGWR